MSPVERPMSDPAPQPSIARSQPWDARTYDRAFSYVNVLAAPLLEWLAPQADEVVLDLGCGTGDLTARIAEAGAHVTGIDRDAGMIAEARAKFPGLVFDARDGHDFAVPRPVHAVFSNAALHWMTRPDDVIRCVRAALVPGGRFVGEFGAGANVSALIAALRAAVADRRLAQPALPWYFPTPAQYAGRLEAGGFEVRRMDYFPRPTALADGDTAADWWRMFGPSVLDQLPAGDVGAILARVDELLAPTLRGADGRWSIDYVRLRFVAIRAGQEAPPVS